MITSSTHLSSAFDTKFYIIDTQIRVRCEQPPVQCVRHQADELLRFEGPRSLHVLTHTDRYTDTLYTTHSHSQSQNHTCRHIHTVTHINAHTHARSHTHTN